MSVLLLMRSHVDFTQRTFIFMFRFWQPELGFQYLLEIFLSVDEMEVKKMDKVLFQCLENRQRIDIRKNVGKAAIGFCWE